MNPGTEFYVDTHCHIDSILEKLGLDSFQQLQREFPPEFESCITVACEVGSFDFAREFIKREQGYAAFGIHPHEAETYTEKMKTDLRELLGHPRAVAWGEMGLDYHYEYSPREIQRNVFVNQMQSAVGLGKPIVVHTREAEEDTLDLMMENLPPTWKIHVHCFTSSAELAGKMLQHFQNLYLGYTGIVTFKNAENVREAVGLTALNRILLETDAPYLAPAPHRGKVCHPGHIPLIAEKIAEIKNTTVSDLYRQCRANTLAMYGV